MCVRGLVKCELTATERIFLGGIFSKSTAILNTYLMNAKPLKLHFLLTSTITQIIINF